MAEKWAYENPDAKRRASRDSIRRFKVWVMSLKDGPCSRCGRKFHPAAMDWHHRDPKTKEIAIGQHVYARARILAEIEKCDLICANCHRILHYKEHHDRTSD